ncbi:MAG: hypothetical protein HKN24_13435 [Acidimicrobiales bacterium]|nr:hypothetical protein [Acidimicrobiales bacterium]
MTKKSADAELGSIFGTDTQFSDVELNALRAENHRLRAELASRTEAWRVALRDLSAAQIELSRLRGEIATQQMAGLSAGDWEEIQSVEIDQTEPDR